MKWWERADGGKMPTDCPACGQKLSGSMVTKEADLPPVCIYLPCRCVERPS